MAVAGLLVNGLSVFTLGHQNHDHAPEDDHDDDPYAQTAGYGHSHEHDYNLRAAYLHVMADALTSILAIVALLSGKYYGLVWMDPMMGIVGAILVSKWSPGLLRSTSGAFLDKQATGPPGRNSERKY